MVARNTKSGSQSPYYNVHVELDNRALKAKNSGLTQAVAKLQQENAELSKQMNLLQQESFEINSKYINLKNVISIIDSTTKTCLPKLTEVVDTFTGIIQLCAVASNISNTSTSSTGKDTRTQAVKPQIVNGHVLHNPTITLSRLDSEAAAYSPLRPSSSQNSSNITVRPGTSRSTSDHSSERHASLSDHEDDSESENDDENRVNGTEDQNSSLRCQANRGVCRRKQSSFTNNQTELEDDDSDSSSDGESEMPVAEEENEDGESEQRLTTIQEDEEDDEEEVLSPLTPKSKQRRFLKGRLQEVRIYLNQLPDNYIKEFSGSGNISISVSPPERRSSFKHRSSSLVGEANESNVDNGTSFLDENVSPLNRTKRVAQRENINETFSFNSGQSKVSVSFNSPFSARSPTTSGNGGDSSEPKTILLSEDESTLHNVPTPSTSRFSGDISDESKTVPSKKLDMSVSDVDDKTLTPILQRRSDVSPINEMDSYENLNKLRKSETSLLRSNITKRKYVSEKRREAQVLLNRLSLEKRLSGSPIKKINNIIKTSPITNITEMKTRLRNSGDSKGDGGKDVVCSGSPQQKAMKEEVVETEEISKRTNEDSPTKKVGSRKKRKRSKPKVELPVTQRSSPGRPKRAARPTTMKEPSLIKKLRRSK